MHHFNLFILVLLNFFTLIIVNINICFQSYESELGIIQICFKKMICQNLIKKKTSDLAEAKPDVSLEKSSSSVKMQ